MENFLRVLFLHNDKVIGAVAAMFLLTCMVLLIRSLRAEEDDGQGSLNRRDPLLDLSAIEGAMRRVLSAQELAAEKSVVGGGATSKINLTGENIGDAIESSEGSEKTEGAITSTATSSSPDKKSETVAADPQKLAEMKAQMAARDKKIAALEEQMKRPQADGGGSAADLEALKSEIANLQGRLAEYEVIEDDIADLSLFREENARLKDEVEGLRRLVDNAGGKDKSVSDGFDLDPTDEVMKKFAEAVDAPVPPVETASMIPADEVQAILNEELDTAKMLSEVEGLAAEPTVDSKQEDSALEERIDTDKLLSEVGALSSDVDVPPQDDLLAEFKDSAIEDD